MTQVSAVLLINSDGTADVLFATEDLPVVCTWYNLPEAHGYWTFRGDMFGSTHALVGEYSPTTANDLAGFGMAIPDGLLGMAAEPWIHGDIVPVRVEAVEWDALSEEFLVAYLYQSPDQLDAGMRITRYNFVLRRWLLDKGDIIVAWRAMPDFPVDML